MALIGFQLPYRHWLNLIGSIILNAFHIWLSKVYGTPVMLSCVCLTFWKPNRVKQLEHLLGKYYKGQNMFAQPTKSFTRIFFLTILIQTRLYVIVFVAVFLNAWFDKDIFGIIIDVMNGCRLRWGWPTLDGWSNFVFFFSILIFLHQIMLWMAICTLVKWGLKAAGGWV